MAFNIPNAVDAEDPSQAMPDSRDFTDIIIPALSGTGVVTGCAVTPQGAPNMTVAVAAGTVAVAGASAAVAGGNVTIVVADATNPRFDLIVADNAGTKSAIAGTPAAAPVFPSAAGKVVLAAVRVPAGGTAINAAKITDKRVTAVIAAPAQETGSMKFWPSSVAPASWVLADGASYLRADGVHDALFALIGTTYGFADGTHFNVPDCRGRVPVGVGTHADVSALSKTEGGGSAGAGGVAVASRRPKHTTDPTNMGISGAPSLGSLVVTGAPSAGTLAVPGNDSNGNPTGGTGIVWGDGAGTPVTGAPGIGSLAVGGAPGVGTLDVNGTGGPSGTAPADEVAFIALNVIIKL